jgi:glycosyltransferase involved in cell wall biosynthesis
MTQPRTGKRVLMIAFHFPPFGASSGVQRTLRFVQHLPGYGWEPVVLAPHPRAYASRRDDLLKEIPETTPVHRAFALDAARHLAIHGRFPGWLAFPDRIGSWLLGAVPMGLKLIRQYRPAVLWSTYPIATAHLIAYVLARLSGLPWVADFRDPMLYEAWPEDPFARRSAGWVEGLVMKRCNRAVFVTDGAVELYRSRYPGMQADRFVLIPNGYDERAFAGIKRRGSPTHDRPYTLVHSGSLEPADRDPASLFAALSALKCSGELSPARLRVVLRATGYDKRYRPQIEALGLQDIVTLASSLPYREALEETVEADGLLLIQGPTCNRQIPAKLYEYMRGGRPIFAITDPAGDTCRLLEHCGVRDVVRFGAPEDIAAGLRGFLARLDAGSPPRLSDELVRRYDRKTLTGDLARLLDEVVEQAPQPRL